MMNTPIVIRLIVTTVFLVAMINLSIAPGRPQPSDSVFEWLVGVTPTPLQKILHVIAYATLAMLLVWSLEQINSVTMRIVLALMFTISLGSFLEWYQTSVPGRFGTLLDALLNALGAVIGLIIAALLI